MEGLLPSGFEFGQPYWLLAALPLLALIAWRRSPGWWWRAATIVALCVALAAPSRLGSPGHLAVLLDVSDSVGSSALSAARALDPSALGTAPMFAFVAADTALVEGPYARIPPGLATDSTDLARALQVGIANGASRILLVSDGITPPQDLLASLPGVPVDVLPVPRAPDARVVDLLVPTRMAPGQAGRATAVVRSDRSGGATLTARVGGQVVEERQVELVAGEDLAVVVPFTAPQGAPDGTELAVTVELTVPFEQPRGNDSAERLVALAGRPPVLVIDDPATAGLLALQGFPVTEGGPEALTFPLPYSAVVVRGSSGAFSRTQLDLLAQYVRDGGGLLMTGGPESFGLGSWYRTPLEEVLPVTTDLRTEVSLPLVAMVMVIDRSQSMASGRPTRLDLAKEGAAQVVDLAYEQDLLGLIAFSDGPGTRWVFQLRPATERGKREMAAGIYALDTGGGTVLAPAYKQAIAALESTEAAVKHVIVLSDGQLYDNSPFGGEATDFGALARDALGNGITTSTIAIGDSADFERLADIARAGGGRYYAAVDATGLPRIFTNEALTATRSLLVDDPTPLRAHPNPLYSFPATLPSVDAYVATGLRSGAQLLLAGRDDEPLLATYRTGLGRSAALTTDLNSWAGELGTWPDLPGLLATVLRWLQVKPDGMVAVAERSGNSVKVTLDAVEGGEYVNDLDVTARFGIGAASLHQVAPGRYEGSVPWNSAAGKDVVISAGTELVARARVVGPDPEYAEVDGHALLLAVAERTGGQLVNAEVYEPALPSTRTPAWRWPLAAALAFFLAELLGRRLSASPTAQRTGSRSGGKGA